MKTISAKDAKIVVFGEGSDRAAFALSQAPLGALHKAASPGVGRGITNGPEDGLSRRRRKAPARQCEGGLDREAIGIGEPFGRIPLSRLAERRELIRVGRGVYLLPVTSRFHAAPWLRLIRGRS